MTDYHSVVCMGVIFGYLAGMLMALCSMGDGRFKAQATLIAGLIIGLIVGLIV